MIIKESEINEITIFVQSQLIRDVMPVLIPLECDCGKPFFFKSTQPIKEHSSNDSWTTADICPACFRNHEITICHDAYGDED